MRRGTAWFMVAAAAILLPFAAAQAAPDLPLLAYQPGINPQTFLPISYTCPAGQRGIVEVVKMSPVGARIRMRVTFDGEAATQAIVERAFRDRPFEGWYTFDNPRKRPEAEPDRTILQTALTDTDSIRMAICQGVPATREKYDAILEHNRRHLKPPAD